MESKDVEFGDRDRDEDLDYSDYDLDLVDSVYSVDLAGWTLSSSTKSLGSGMGVKPVLALGLWNPDLKTRALLLFFLWASSSFISLDS